MAILLTDSATGADLSKTDENAIASEQTESNADQSGGDPESDTDSGSETATAPVRRSSRANKGAPPTRYGVGYTHMVLPVHEEEIFV